MKFDFKKYHYRAMNAANEAEKNAINQELKDLYASLSSEDQKIFNDELERFMIREYANISEQMDALKNEQGEQGPVN